MFVEAELMDDATLNWHTGTAMQHRTGVKRSLEYMNSLSILSSSYGNVANGNVHMRGCVFQCSWGIGPMGWGASAIESPRCILDTDPFPHGAGHDDAGDDRGDDAGDDGTGGGGATKTRPSKKARKGR